MNKNRSSIGERLRGARITKGISLEDASIETRIHHKVLSALEEDRFGELPSLMYVKGFLKRYAEYLGLDSGSIVKEYMATHPKEPEQVLLLESEGAKRKDLRRFILLVSTGIFVLLLLSFGSYFIIKSFTSRPKEAVGIADEAKVPASAPLAVKQPREPKDKPLFEALRVSVRAKEDVWLEVSVDGKVMFQDILSPGYKESWQAEERVVLRVGNAGAIELQLNGKSLGAPGALGEVIDNIVLTNKGMTIE